jgi:hypothetical protein
LRPATAFVTARGLGHIASSWGINNAQGMISY